VLTVDRGFDLRLSNIEGRDSISLRVMGTQVCHSSDEHEQDRAKKGRRYRTFNDRVAVLMICGCQESKRGNVDISVRSWMHYFTLI
jgi:hypothetical protein